MGKTSKRPDFSEVAALRTALIAFVRKATYRTEAAIVEYIMNNLRFCGCHISNRDAEYCLARCVEDGPLMWFGADEEPLRYRYAPLVSQKEKSMEIEGLVEINTIVSLYKRCRKKNKPVEPALEALNKLGARRPTKQRFSLSLCEGTLTLRAKNSEYLPESLQRLADNTVVGEDLTCMKHYAVLVSEPAGDTRTESVMGLVHLDEDGLEQLKKIRQLVQTINTKARSIHRSLAYLSFYTIDVNWLLVEDEEEDKLYSALGLTDDGYLEIPQDVHDQRLRDAQEDVDQNMVCTENDFVRFTEHGLYFVCEERHCYASLETHFLPWYMLFDEPVPAALIPPRKL